LGKSRQSGTKPQKKCHPLSLSQDETHRHPRNKRVETSGNSPAQLQQGNLSTNSGAPVQESEAVNLGENWSSGDQLNLLHFPSNPDRSPNWNFARFLGPHSLEDIFRSDSEYSGDIISSTLDSTTMPLSQNFDSLDQYVSMLDVQEGQEYLYSINNPANSESLSTYAGLDNAVFNNSGNRTFTPLSPSIIETCLPVGNLLGLPIRFVFAKNF
jgi:hypothetical protein